MLSTALQLALPSPQQPEPQGRGQPPKGVAHPDEEHEGHPLPELGIEKLRLEEHARQCLSQQPIPVARVQVGNGGDTRGRELPDEDAVRPWDPLEPHVDRQPWGLDAPHVLHIRGQAILEVPGRAVAHAVAVDRELLVQHDLQMTGQPWPQALCFLGREVSQVEIPGGPLVVARADRLAESHYRSARRAPVQVVNRLRWRLRARLVPLCLNSLLRVWLPPGWAQGEPEQ